VDNPDNHNARRGVSQNNMSMLSETAYKRRWTQICFDMAAQTYVIKNPCFAIFMYFAVENAQYLLTFYYNFIWRGRVPEAANMNTNKGKKTVFKHFELSSCIKKPQRAQSTQRKAALLCVLV